MFGYHATKKESAASILEKGFVLKRRENHWLGQGIYFFENKVDAETWAKGTYYIKGDSCIIKCMIEARESEYLNLDSPENVEALTEYTENVKAVLSKKGISHVFDNEHVHLCWALDLFKADKGIKVIKRTFENQRTRKINGYKYNKSLGLKYYEVQICTTGNDSIVDKKIC